MIEPVLRPAARVVILGPDDHLLLQHISTLEGWDGWITPGGGLDEGETHLEAALRELHEEIGLVGVHLEGPVWERRAVFPWNGETYDQREQFFVARLSELHDPVPTMSAEQLARDRVVDHRWFTLDEIDSLHVAPEDLVARIRALRDD